MGSKEGLASLATAVIAPGDVILAPDPSYPIHTFGFIMAGATIRSVPTTPDEHYFARLEQAMAMPGRRPKLLVVNYPSNPTAETVELSFYERLVAFAREQDLWIVSDLAYSELYYDGKPTVSILQVKGAKDVAVEFTSLSKTYSMAGWRIGFAVGNSKLIAATARVKSYLDYGAFTPIQAAACAALNGPQDIVEQNRQLYHKRRDVLIESFGRSGWDIPAPPASMFAWAPIPPALAHLGSLEFSKQLLTHPHVHPTPWDATTNMVDGWLDSIGCERRIIAKANTYQACLNIIQRTPLMFSLPRRLLPLLKISDALHVLEPPIGFPKFTLDIIWSKRRASDSQWLRNQLDRVVRDLITS